MRKIIVKKKENCKTVYLKTNQKLLSGWGGYKKHPCEIPIMQIFTV
jgi:hypothetical protein